MQGKEKREKGEVNAIIWLLLISCSGMSDSFVTAWTIAHKAPLSMGLPRQEYWSRLPFPPPGDLPDPGIEPVSPMSVSCIGRQILHH